MDNHWTRALRECCEHTQPICVPCADCTGKIVERLRGIVLNEAKQQASAEQNEMGHRLKSIKQDIDKLETRNVELSKVIQRQANEYRALELQKKETDRLYSDLRARETATNTVDAQRDVIPFKNRIATE